MTLYGQIMVVPYTVNRGTFEAGKPRQWVGRRITLQGNPMPYDQAPDGNASLCFWRRKARPAERRPVSM